MRKGKLGNQFFSRNFELVRRRRTFFGTANQFSGFPKQIILYLRISQIKSSGNFQQGFIYTALVYPFSKPNLGINSRSRKIVPGLRTISARIFSVFRGDIRSNLLTNVKAIQQKLFSMSEKRLKTTGHAPFCLMFSTLICTNGMERLFPISRQRSRSRKAIWHRKSPKIHTILTSLLSAENMMKKN